MPAAVRSGRLALLVPLLIAAAWFLWPAALGGGTTYLGTHGVSMQPLFHSGDLALLRSSATYDVGDVIAYRSPTLRTTVLHRIVAVEDGAVTTQGDNNSWQDPDHPTQDQILGRLWMAVPHGGQLLASLRSPLGISTLGLAVISVTGLLGARRSRRGPRGQLPVTTRAAARRVAPVAAAVAAAAAIGGVAAFVVPTTHTVAGSADLTVRGQYSYSGPAQRGVTYPDGRITTGDTVWRSLAGELTVALEASVDGAGSSGTTGTVRLDLSVATSDGWSAPIGSGPAAAFSDGSATALVPVDLAAADDLVHRHYAEIGGSGEDAVLTVTPVGEIEGVAGGRSFTAAAPAPISLPFNSSSLRPPAADALTPSAPVRLTVPEVAPTTLAALGLTVPVSTLRALACLVAAAALATAAIAWSIGWSGARPGDDLLLRDPRRVLAVTALPELGAVVDLPDAAALHRVAARVDGFVLQQEDADGATFLVQDGPTTYRFRQAAAAQPAVRPPHTSHRRPAPSLRRAVTRVALS